MFDIFEIDFLQLLFVQGVASCCELTQLINVLVENVGTNKVFTVKTR